MAVTSIEQLKDAFRQRSRADLEELALVSSLAHARVCEIASYHPPERHGDGEHEGDRHRHASESEMRERIQRMNADELVTLIAELAAAAEVAKA